MKIKLVLLALKVFTVTTDCIPSCRTVISGLLSALEPGITCAGKEETATATATTCVAYVGATVVTLAITK